MNDHFHLGEIVVPGASRSSGVKTFILTRPSGDGTAKVFFGLFASTAPRKAHDKLIDRVSEAAAPTFFDGQGAADERFEASLKQANKAILGFLHEQGLSLPGIKLRGVLAAFEAGELLLTNRGGMRGVALFPKAGAMTGMRLFQESPDTSTNPKFFSSFQSGRLPPGSRAVLATKELFESIDEPHLRDLFSGAAPADAARRLKQQVRGRALAAAVTLSVPADASSADVPSPPPPKRAKAPEPVRRAEPAGFDIGELGAKTVEGALVLLWNGLKAVPKGMLAGARRLAAFGPVLVRLPSAMRRVDWRRAHRDLASAGMDRLNAMPRRSKAHLVLLLVVSAVFVHGLIWSFHRHSVALEAKAYEAKLAEIEQLKTEIETSLIIGNDRRSHDVIARLEAAFASLPEETEAERRAKAEVRAFIDAKRDVLRRVVAISDPERVADVSDPSSAFSEAVLVWFDRSFYLFSGSGGDVRAVALDGNVTEASLTNAPSGVAAAAPARTGILLRFTNGQVGFWDPRSAEIELYPEIGADQPPILYYEGRLYSVRGDGMVERRSIVSSGLGSPADVLQSPSDLSKVSSIAADGAAYLLSPSGELRKYMKGLPVGEFRPPIVEPTPVNASDLWADPASPWLVFMEKGGDRVYVVDAASGKLAAQMASPAFAPLVSATVDPKGEYIYLYGNGAVWSIPLKPAVR